MLRRLQNRYAKKATLLVPLALCMATVGVAASRGNSSQAGTSSTITFAKGEPTSPPPAPRNPCTLLTQAEVESATNTAVAAGVERPLGPTCIFATSTGKVVLTVAIEPRAPVPTKQLQSVTIAGHSAYCGQLGKTQLDLFLGKYTMLNITGPCLAASQLANLAVGRL